MKKSFLLDKKVGPIYHGESRIAKLTGTENILVPFSGQVTIRNARSFEQESVVGSPVQNDDDEVVVKVLAVHGFDSTIVMAKSSGQVEVYDMSKSLTEPQRTWKTVDNASVTRLVCESQGGRVAVGFSDGFIRLYDLNGGFCVATLKGQHRGLINSILLNENRLFSAGDDGLVVEWDLSKKGAALRSSNIHKSAVTALDMDEKYLVSVSRDGTVTFFKRAALEVVKSFSVLESVEDVKSIGDGKFIIVGDKGTVRIISLDGILASSERFTGDSHSLLQLLTCADSLALAVSSDSLIFSFSSKDLQVKETIIGNPGEITDVSILPNGELVVATGDADLKIFPKLDSFSCRLLKGHSESVVSVASCGDFIISGSRDNTFRIWSASESLCLFTGQGHTDVVSAVAVLDDGHGNLLIATGSSDLTIKLWKFVVSSRSCSCMWTIKAHDKDINSLAFLSSSLLLSGSQDKTVKAWNVGKGTMNGAPMTGHKRGIWSISVFNADTFATGSGDKTIRIWSFSSRQSVKTLEGHGNSVLRVAFLPEGNTLLAVDSDGLVRIWDVRKGLLTDTLDEHADRIWTCAVVQDGSAFVTADSVGVRNIWRDASEEVAEELAKEKAETAIKEQRLANLIYSKEYCAALTMTLQMDQPGRSLSLIQKMIHECGIEKSVELLGSVMKQVESEQLEKALKWIREWNSNFKRSLPANLLLRSILIHTPLAQLRERVPGFSALAADMTPFMDRHVRKIQDLTTSSHMADLALTCMEQ